MNQPQKRPPFFKKGPGNRPVDPKKKRFIPNRTVFKSGAIVMRKNEEVGYEFLLIYRGRQKDWAFPKGSPEQGESLLETMVREVQEETGIHVRPLTKLPNMTYSSVYEGRAIVHMYLAVTSDAHQKLKIERERDVLMWVPLDAVDKVLSHMNLRVYFKNLRERIIEIFNRELQGELS